MILFGILSFVIIYSALQLQFTTIDAGKHHSEPSSRLRSVDPTQRALELLAQMNSTEKIKMLHGVHGTYTGNVPANDRLGIPSLNLNDGPQGFRTGSNTGPVGSTTAWPSALTVAASFDEDLLYRWAAAMAQEFKGKGANVALAPGMGIARVPTAGRNFEYLCGEDPYLGSVMSAAAVKGIQAQGVIANAKHWINNEIEDQRMLVSAEVEERVRFELYYPPFEASIQAGVLSVMCSYNRIGGVYACENEETLGHLKNTLGFKGWVMSDWTATHSTVDALNNGLDQEMPAGLFFNQRTIEEAVEAGSISLEKIDDSVLRILTAMYSIGLFDEAPSGSPNAIVTSDEHNQLAREIAAKSTVLLKNAAPVGAKAALLPLDSGIQATSSESTASFAIVASSIKRILVLGDNSTISGGGSGNVDPSYIVTPFDGIANHLANTAIEVVYDSGDNVQTAADLSAAFDVTIVVAATSSSEGSDRDTLSLGDHYNELITAVAAANPNTIVAVNSPGACLMPWAAQVPAVLLMWMPGQEWGNALADVMFGAVNPSARLPITIPNTDNEVAFSTEQYPGVGHPPTAVYSEELLIGYRYYDAKGINPMFPFGHGLSYSTFTYSQLSVQQASTEDSTAAFDVEFTVENTSPLRSMSGQDTPQLYISFPPEAEEPPMQLKGFTKTALLVPGSAVKVKFTLRKRDLSIWDTAQHDWKLFPGTYGIMVAASSRDIRLRTEVQL